jgi:hypothetical protein
MIPLLSDDRERGKPRITLKKKPQSKAGFSHRIFVRLQTRRWTLY